MHRPRLSENKIVEWAKAHFKRFGRYPSGMMGPIVGEPGETWSGINSALGKGDRGLPGGDSLASLLRRRVGKMRRQYKPVLSREQVIAWAREHFSRTGRWPNAASGRVIGGGGESWTSLNTALHEGFRGLPGGSSLSHLLDQVAGPLRWRTKPTFSIRQIVEWARQHRRRTGDWPINRTGPIREAPGETWYAVGAALQLGQRGLPGGDTLARVLNRYCGKPPGRQRRRLSTAQILKWADAYHRRHGCWPSLKAGSVDGVSRLSWNHVDYSLRCGTGGVLTGRSLAKLLRKERGASALPGSIKLDVDQILRWADADHRRTGRWPTRSIARLTEGMPLTWATIDKRLQAGRVRGAPAGTRLTELLIKRRGATFRIAPGTPLYLDQVLAWTDDHHKRTGSWPKNLSGPVLGGPAGLTWCQISHALRNGGRGLPRAGSLARLLTRYRGVRNIRDLPPLSVDQILGWADAFHDRTGRWPPIEAGEIPESPGEKWTKVDYALVHGIRGLPGGDTLPGLLARRRGLRRTGYKPKLTVDQILAWAAAHHRQTGRWPSCGAGAVRAAPDETWTAVNGALKDGYRGLSKGLTLSRLLDTIRGKSADLARKRSLKLPEVIMWAKAHHRRTHEWPDMYAGRVVDAKGETWFGIDEALRLGLRGLPGGSSLAQLVRGLKKPRPIRLGYARRHSLRVV